MEGEKKIPQLYTLLFGEQAETAERGASDRLRRWAAAFEAWLDERLRLYQPSVAYLALWAWRVLLGAQRKLPYEFTQADIESHLAWLQERDYALNSVNQMLGNISGFYCWCGEQGGRPRVWTWL